MSTELRQIHLSNQCGFFCNLEKCETHQSMNDDKKLTLLDDSDRSFYEEIHIQAYWRNHCEAT